MTKLFYVLVVVVGLVPSLLIGVTAIRACREAERLLSEEQRRFLGPDHSISNHVYVLSLPGCSLEIYPRVWAALLILIGCIACLAGAGFLLFVRQS
jgi:hypothetical protein